RRILNLRGRGNNRPVSLKRLCPVGLRSGLAAVPSGSGGLIRPWPKSFLSFWTNRFPTSHYVVERNRMVVAMNNEPRTAKAIFVELVSNVPTDDWDERLEQACQENDELRNRVRALLRAHAQPGSFLEHPAMAPDTTVIDESPISEG